LGYLQATWFLANKQCGMDAQKTLPLWREAFEYFFYLLVYAVWEK
jgi:hypothetical protein